MTEQRISIKRHLISHGRLLRGCVADVGEWHLIREMTFSADPAKPVTYGPHCGYAKSRDDARLWAAAPKLEQACRLLVNLSNNPDSDPDGEATIEKALSLARDAVSELDIPKEDYIAAMVEKFLKFSDSGESNDTSLESKDELEHQL